MKTYLYILIILLCVACQTHNRPTIPTTQADSTYLIADIRSHGDYYNSGHYVYAVDLLSEGLHYDSLGYIVGSGYNLFISDIFTHKDSTIGIPAGTYHMDSTAKEMSFLRGMYFEDNLTGTYLLEISDNQIKHITLFTTGEIRVDYLNGDTLMDFTLYTADSSRYHATYTGHKQ